MSTWLDTRLPPLRGPKSPGLAAVIGFLTGGIGLAVYFRSVRDFLPVDVAAGLVILGSLAFGASPFALAGIVAPLLGALYGFWRARSSNRRLPAAGSPAFADR